MVYSNLPGSCSLILLFLFPNYCGKQDKWFAQKLFSLKFNHLASKLLLNKIQAIGKFIKNN